MTTKEIAIIFIAVYLLIGLLYSFYVVRQLGKEGHTVEDAARRTWKENAKAGAVVVIITIILGWPHAVYFFHFRQSK